MSSPQGYAAQTQTVAVAAARKSQVAWRHREAVQPVLSETLASDLADPEGIAVDGRGAVYVAESSLHRIVRLR
jgi:hypothetical protein